MSTHDVTQEEDIRRKRSLMKTVLVVEDFDETRFMLTTDKTNDASDLKVARNKMGFWVLQGTNLHYLQPAL